jgi:hypothetical protein
MSLRYWPEGSPKVSLSLATLLGLSAADPRWITGQCLVVPIDSCQIHRWPRAGVNSGARYLDSKSSSGIGLPIK